MRPYASYETPAKKEDPFFILAYIGCQADKMNEAIDGMNALLNDLPVSEKGFDLAMTGEKKDIETQRFTGMRSYLPTWKIDRRGWITISGRRSTGNWIA